MWAMLPLAMSVLNGMQQAKEAQRQNDINVVKEGTNSGKEGSPGHSTNLVGQPSSWGAIGQGVVGGIAANREGAQNDTYMDFMKAMDEKNAEGAEKSAPREIEIPDFAGSLKLGKGMDDGSTWSVMGRPKQAYAPKGSF